MSKNNNNLNHWIGKEEVTHATISLQTANLMNAALNREPIFQEGDPLPPAWHWLYFHKAVRGVDLGVEGHAKLGGFMPPVDFGGEEPPRRMWAGGTLALSAPIPLGSQATKRSTVKSITPKEGRSGKLVFVLVEHGISVEGQSCLVEEQTIVYREPVRSEGGAVAAQPAPSDGEFSQSYQPDPMQPHRLSH